MIYHIFIKFSLNPEWLVKFNNFWSELAAQGYSQNDGTLTLQSENDVQVIMQFAQKYGIEVKLIKQ